VISTLHAGSCRGVFERLQIMYSDGATVASATELVLNQRLIRKLCSECNGAGCNTCLRTGYRGRIPLVEWLRVDSTMRESIRRRELQCVVPRKGLEESARELLTHNLTNDAEYGRTFGL
jgi:type II secretory ATPase GspE/PulE/Tfp pilus assembly ATPase PilB-like protein